MEKIEFSFEDGNGSVWFYVLEQTKFNEQQYILVTDSKEGDGDAFILRDLSSADADEAYYEMVEDDIELDAVAKIFAELLDDADIGLK